MKYYWLLIMPLIILLTSCAPTRLFTIKTAKDFRSVVQSIDHITVMQPIVKIRKIPSQVNDNYYNSYQSIEMLNKFTNDKLKGLFSVQFDQELNSEMPNDIYYEVDCWLGKLQRPYPNTFESVKMNKKVKTFFKKKPGRYRLVILQKGYVRKDESVDRGFRWVADKGHGLYPHKQTSTLVVALIDSNENKALYFNEASGYTDPFLEESIEKDLNKVLAELIAFKTGAIR